MDVIARLDAVVDDYNRRNRYFNTPLTRERAETFVRQHRLNTRQRNSVHKLAVATNCPDWDIRIRIIGASAQEVIADNEFGSGKAHWEILEDLGVAIGMQREAIRAAEPLPSTQLCWLARTSPGTGSGGTVRSDGPACSAISGGSSSACATISWSFGVSIAKPISSIRTSAGTPWRNTRKK